ncbi:MAG: RidA family protein [Acidobacteria bacterium]|nr:RidA family protein [Acidobacteriota bacterium]
MSFERVNPPELVPPRGWNHGMLAPAGGRLLFVAGQTARRDESERLPSSFVEQFARALDNLLAVVRAAGGTAEDVGRLTVYVTDLPAYQASLKPLGEAYRERMGRHFPAMALVEVNALVDPGAVVEIEATAVLPPAPRE